MEEGISLIAMTAILCGTGVVVLVVQTIRAAILGRPNRNEQSELLAEIRSLRAEVSQLRQQNNDLILGFDGAVQGLERRVGSLESRPTAAPQEQQGVGVQR
jgi:hypothetical protein